jgi:glutaredoxin
VREFLSDAKVPFVDRNIRGSDDARADLLARTGALIVPQLFWGDHHLVGYDPDALDAIAAAYHAGS